MKKTFQIYSSGEPNAGLAGVCDKVTIIVESGDPGGEPGEFSDFICQSLSDWYNGAAVTEIDQTPED